MIVISLSMTEWHIYIWRYFLSKIIQITETYLRAPEIWQNKQHSLHMKEQRRAISIWSQTTSLI